MSGFWFQSSERTLADFIHASDKQLSFPLIQVFVVENELALLFPLNSGGPYLCRPLQFSFESSVLRECSDCPVERLFLVMLHQPKKRLIFLYLFPVEQFPLPEVFLCLRHVESLEVVVKQLPCMLLREGKSLSQLIPLVFIKLLVLSQNLILEHHFI
jgi:hypothetical protein